MISPIEVNPYAPAPESASSGIWLSGGGGDGQVSEIVVNLLFQVNAAPEVAPQLTPPRPGTRDFDFAEAVAWAGAASGLDVTLPSSAAQLRALCSRRRTMTGVDPAAKGLLLFGAGLVGVTLGLGRRVITYDQVAGTVAVPAGAWRWAEAARIPSGRGYR